MCKRIKSIRFAGLAFIGSDETPACLTAGFGQGGGRTFHPDFIRMHAKGEL
jgi:hypothetical protein